MPLTISAQYGLIDQNEFFDKRIASKDVRGYYLIKKGEFAYNKSTSVDAPFGAIKRLDKYNKGVLSTLYILFKIIDDTNTSSDYLVTYYSTDLWHKGIQLIAAEGARNHGLLNITPNDFFKTMLSIPLNVFEQQKIGNFFKSLDHLITLHQSKPFGHILKVIASYTLYWEQRKLLSITTMHARIGWQNLRTTEFLDDGKYLLITGTDFVDGKIDFTRCYYVKQERYNQDRNIQIKNGCILITKDGTLGKVAYVNGLNKPATLNAGIFNVEIRDENKVDRLYLYQYIKAPFLLEYVNQMATGGTIKHLNQNILVDFMVSMPQSMEQKKIGELFQILDHLITLHQRKLEKLKIIKRSMLENLFPKNGEKTPKIRFSGFTEDWEQRKAKELCTIGTGESNTQDQAEDGMYTFYIRSEIPVKSNKYLYDCEAVITIGDGNIGRVFHYVNGKFDLHQRCYKMTDFENVWGKYFYYFFSTRFYDRAMKMTAKATVDSVRIEMISEMYILKPAEINEQKNIADFFTHLDHLITLHQSKLEKLQKIKKSMLESMFA